MYSFLHFKYENKYILFVYLFLFLTPLALFKSQVAIFSIILVIWGFIRYKNVLEKLKILFEFKPLMLWISFVLFCYIASLWSDSIATGFHRVWNYHKYEMLFGVALLISLKKEQAIVGIKIMIISFTLYSIYSIFIYYNIIVVEGSSHVNPKGYLRFSISTQYMVIAAFLSAFFAFYEKNKKFKIFFIMISLISIFTLFINYSRTSQLAFILICFVFLVIFSFKNIKLGIFNFLLLIVLIIGISQNRHMIKKFDRAINEVQRIYNNDIYSGSFGARLFFNKAGIEIIKENIFFGMGPVDNRKKLVEIEKNSKEYHMRIIKHFHSEHMEILTAYGLIGYTLIFSAVVLLIYKLKEYDMYFYMSLSVFLTLFFVSFANKTLALKPLNYVYVIFFILFSIIAYQTEREKTNK